MVGNKAHLVLGVDHLVREGASLLLNSFELGSRGIASLGLTGLAREDNKLALVQLQALHIGLQALGRTVLAAVVNGNANGTRIQGRDAGFLLGVRKTHIIERK